MWFLILFIFVTGLPANPENKPTNTDINTEENTFLGVEQKNKENVLTNEYPKGGQEQM